MLRELGEAPAGLDVGLALYTVSLSLAMLLPSTARYTGLTMLFPLAAMSPVKGSKIFLEIFESPFACLLMAGGLGPGGPPFRHDIQMKSGRDTQRTTCTPNAGKTRRASALTLFWKQSLQVD